MAILRSETRPGAYHDSIVLIQLQAELAALPEVEEAAVVMGTEANLALLAERGLRAALSVGVQADDLVVVVAAASEAAAAAALSQIDPLLERRGEYRPRSLSGAVRLLPEARWVLVSVPGRAMPSPSVARRSSSSGTSSSTATTCRSNRSWSSNGRARQQGSWF